MSLVQEAAAEVNGLIIDMQDELEGLKDFQRLNLTGEAQTVIAEQINAYTRRQGLLAEAKLRMEALLADGYPAIGARAVSGAVLQDLQNNLNTLNAARLLFTSNEASTLGLDAGEPVVKP